MTRRQMLTCGIAIALLGGVSGWTGCVSVRGPDEIKVNAGYRPARIDSSHLPPTRNHEEARHRLAEAYERNQYLEHKVEKLAKKNRKLKEQRDEYKRKYKREKDHNDD